jgi:hypothetical protein
MISKVIEHSTRNISFSTDELKSWTEDDEQLINTYIKVHDQEQLIQDTGKVLADETKLINVEIEQARQNLAEVEKQIKELSKLADTFILPNPKKEEKANQIFNEADKVYKTVTLYQQSLTKLADNIEKFCVLKSDYLNNLEDFTLWDEYDAAKYKHVNNYEINSIDIVSFELEDEFFRAYISVHKESNHGVFDRADKSIENYNALILETKIEYAIWEEFLKRIHLIRAIIESSGDTFVSMAN